VRTCTIKLSDEVRGVLARSRITADSLALPEQLDRKLYEQVDKVLKTAGGKWNRGKKCHLFAGDPREILGLAVESGEIVDKKKTLQFFATPHELADRMVKLAEICPGNRILEPSAGEGNILKAIIRRVYGMPGEPPHIDVVEIDDRMAEVLRDHRAAVVYRDDFMQFLAPELYNRVIANPPFHGGQDIAHILRALHFLKRGGRLVAICANGPKQEAELKPLATTWEELPGGTFPDTNVRAVLLTIDKE
jgi:hypothetical protein